MYFCHYVPKLSWKGVCRIYATAVVGLLAAGATMEMAEGAHSGTRSLTFKGFTSRFDKNGAPPHPATHPTACTS